MEAGNVIQTIGEDTTILLPCREGDHIAWLRGNGFMGDPSSGVTVLDYWELRAGGMVTITSRYEDLPEWFDLYPLEARGRAARALLPRVQSGDVPDAPIEGANLWRVMSGDRLAWTGASRPAHASQEGVLAVFDFEACCLVGGQPRDGTLEEWQFFGAPSSDKPNSDAVAAVRRAIAVVRTLGIGRIRVDGWAIG